MFCFWFQPILHHPLQYFILQFFRNFFFFKFWSLSDSYIWIYLLSIFLKTSLFLRNFLSNLKLFHLSCNLNKPFAIRFFFLYFWGDQILALLACCCSLYRGESKMKVIFFLLYLITYQIWHKVWKSYNKNNLICLLDYCVQFRRCIIFYSFKGELIYSSKLCLSS